MALGGKCPREAVFSCYKNLEGRSGGSHLSSESMESVHCLSVQEGGRGGSGPAWSALRSLNKAAFGVQETPAGAAEEKGLTGLLGAWLAAGDGPCSTC